MLVMVLFSSETWPVAANSLPCTVAPVPSEIDVPAMTVPANVAPLIVAALPTRQKILHGLTLPSTILLPTAVISVPAAGMLKMKISVDEPESVSGLEAESVKLSPLASGS